MTPTIFVLRAIAYVLDGPITVQAQFTAPNPFTPGESFSTNQSITFPQPEGAWGDDAVLAAVQALYPSATVQWMPDAAPTPEPPAE